MYLVFIYVQLYLSVVMLCNHFSTNICITIEFYSKGTIQDSASLPTNSGQFKM